MAEELLLLGIIGILFLLWGSRRLPEIPTEIARTLGRAKKEFEQASRQASSPATTFEKTGDELLREIAEKIGVSVDGKTKDQIADEIVKKATG